MVGTLIDFEQGILDCLHPQLKGSAEVSDQELLEAFARAEDVQQRLTPDIPFGEIPPDRHDRTPSGLRLIAATMMW